MAKSKQEAKVADEAPKVKAKKAKVEDLPTLSGLHPLNPCRQYSTGRDGKRRPSERVFLADEMLRADGTSLKDIQNACAERWAKASIKAGDKRSQEDLEKVYRKAIPVNASTINYMVEKFDLPKAVAKKSGEAISFKFDEDEGELTFVGGGKVKASKKSK